MPRETKVQRDARMAAAAQAREAAEREAYPAALMALLERVTRYPGRYELTVKNGQFVVRDRVDTYLRETEIMLSYSWSRDAQDSLEPLTWQVEGYEQDLAEAERKLKVKQDALAKLTDEERDLLGL